VCLAGAISLPATAEENPVAISCQFIDSVEMEGILSGGIVIELLNVSQEQLINVLVRFAPGSGGAVAGDVRRAIAIAPGEVGVLSGTFSLPAYVMTEQSPLQWEVRYQGSSDQTIEVTSETCSL
jgi:hypothetical protein